jgi:hypothetical protein
MKSTNNLEVTLRLSMLPSVTDVDPAPQWMLPIQDVHFRSSNLKAAQSLSLATRLHDKERAAQPFSFFGVNYEARIPLHFLISSLQPRRERSLSRCSDEFLPSRCFAPVLDPRCFDSRPARIRIVTKITGRWQCGLETDWSLEARHHNVKCDVSCPCSTSSTHLFTRTHQAVDNYTGQRRDRVSARRGAQQKVPSPCLAASPRAQSRPPRVASRREPGNLNMIAARLNTKPAVRGTGAVFGPPSALSLDAPSMLQWGPETPRACTTVWT